MIYDYSDLAADSDDTENCPHCGSDHFKFDFTSNGIPFNICLDCNENFETI